MAQKFECNDVVVMQKKHHCGGYEWQILRTGADIKIKCLTCGHIVMLDYGTFMKRMKKVITNGRKQQ